MFDPLPQNYKEHIWLIQNAKAGVIDQLLICYEIYIRFKKLVADHGSEIQNLSEERY